MSSVNHLYRHFDKDDNLLYVGITFNQFTRLNDHKYASGWYNDITKVTFEKHPDRASAIQAEKKAINEENPKYNIQRYRGKTELTLFIEEPKQTEEEKKEISEKITAAQISKRNIVQRVVNMKPLYTVREVADILKIRPIDLKRILDNPETPLQSIELPYGETTRPYITGFQLIDYLEFIGQ